MELESLQCGQERLPFVFSSYSSRQSLQNNFPPSSSCLGYLATSRQIQHFKFSSGSLTKLYCKAISGVWALNSAPLLFIKGMDRVYLLSQIMNNICKGVLVCAPSPPLRKNARPQAKTLSMQAKSCINWFGCMHHVLPYMYFLLFPLSVLLVESLLSLLLPHLFPVPIKTYMLSLFPHLPVFSSVVSFSLCLILFDSLLYEFVVSCCSCVICLLFFC